MSYASRVTYIADGNTAQFPVTFPFISPSHVDVYQNTVLMIDPLMYSLSGSTVTFVENPGAGDAVELKRNTSPLNLLVDFQDGSVLNESDLDLAYLHNFYLQQEAVDSYNESINNALLAVATSQGIIETDTDEMLAALIASMLEDESAATLQDRITDIDANAESILSLGENLQVQINTLASGIAAEIYIQPTEPVPGVDGVPDPIAEGARWYDSDDNNAPYIYQASAWLSIEDPRIGQAATDISVLQTDVDNNAAAVVTEATARSNADTATASLIALIGAENVAQTAFIINSATVKIDSDSGDTLATRFTALATTDGNNAAAITAEESARITAVGVNATSIENLSASVTTIDGDLDTAEITISAHVSAIADLETFETSVEAEYGVDLTANGYVSGFRLINGGTPGASAFVILADKFAIVDPSGDPGETEYIPMQIVGGKVRFNANVEIDGNLMVSGTINGQTALSATYPLGSTLIGPNAITTTQLNANSVNASKIVAGTITADKITVGNLASINADIGAITAGNITLDTSGFIKGGQTAYDTGTGFFLGYSTDAYKFSIGNGAANSLTWDGTTLSIHGDLFVGVYIVSDTLMLSADTERTNDVESWVEVKKFTMDRPGSIRVKLDGKRENNGSAYIYPTYRWLIDSVEKADGLFAGITYATQSQDISGLSVGSEVTLEIMAGTLYSGEPNEIMAYVKNCRVYGDVLIPAEGGTVDTD